MGKSKFPGKCAKGLHDRAPKVRQCSQCRSIATKAWRDKRRFMSAATAPRRVREPKPVIPFARVTHGIKPYAVLMAEAQLAYHELLEREAQARKGGRPKGSQQTFGKRPDQGPLKQQRMA